MNKKLIIGAGLLALLMGPTQVRAEEDNLESKAEVELSGARLDSYNLHTTIGGEEFANEKKALDDNHYAVLDSLTSTYNEQRSQEDSQTWGKVQQIRSDTYFKQYDDLWDNHNKESTDLFEQNQEDRIRQREIYQEKSVDLQLREDFWQEYVGQKDELWQQWTDKRDSLWQDYVAERDQILDKSDVQNLGEEDMNLLSLLNGKYSVFRREAHMEIYFSPKLELREQFKSRVR